MDITKYNFYFAKENDSYHPSTFRKHKTTLELHVWDSPTIFKWRNSEDTDANLETEFNRRHPKQIKPKLYSCPKCNNTGCIKCKSHYFSIWNKFNGHS